MFQTLRLDLYASNLPIIQVAITCDSSLQSKTPLWQQINNIQLNMQMDDLVTVDATGLSLQQDGLHLDLEGQLCLGSMICDCYLKTWPPKSKVDIGKDEGHAPCHVLDARTEPECQMNSITSQLACPGPKNGVATM